MEALLTILFVAAVTVYFVLFVDTGNSATRARDGR